MLHSNIFTENENIYVIKGLLSVSESSGTKEMFGSLPNENRSPYVCCHTRTLKIVDQGYFDFKSNLIHGGFVLPLVCVMLWSHLSSIHLIWSFE